MIEVKLADDSYIYIDFAYKGIPNDFNISKIEIRDPPKDSEKALSFEDGQMSLRLDPTPTKPYIIFAQ